MKKQIFTTLTLLVLLFTAACSVSTGNSSTSAITATDTTNQTTQSSTTASSGTTVEVTPTELDTHEAESDYTWNTSDEVNITLDGSTITASGSGVIIDGCIATIASAGSYRLSGTLNDGQIIVNSEAEAPIHLILDGVNISNSSSTAINIEAADKVIIILAEGSDNTLTDASDYVYPSADVDEPNAALFSKDDLTIYGSGELTVNGNFNDAIGSKDGLVIRDANITVNALDDGIRGKDYLVIADSTLSVTWAVMG